MDLTQEKTLCKARRRNGEPCKNPPMNGSTVCRMHGGAAPQVRRRAQQRILEASDKAAYRLVQMMQDKTVPPAVQLAAARDLLDRANVVGTQQVNVEVGIASWEQHMSEVIVNYVLTDDDENTEDAVLVDDSDEAAEAHHDEQLRELEATRAKRKRRGQPLSLPSEEVSSRQPARAALPGQPLHQDGETPAWYSPFPSAGPTGLRPLRPTKRQ
jgi:hypothetical protein